MRRRRSALVCGVGLGSWFSFSDSEPSLASDASDSESESESEPESVSSSDWGSGLEDGCDSGLGLVVVGVLSFCAASAPAAAASAVSSSASSESEPSSSEPDCSSSESKPDSETGLASGLETLAGGDGLVTELSTALSVSSSELDSSSDSDSSGGVGGLFGEESFLDSDCLRGVPFGLGICGFSVTLERLST